jgi:rfaE bifunctional protein kinase chain/domain
MLTDALIEHILARIPTLTIGVIGDLFLDRYLDIDASLTEPSIETGLDAYQVVRVRSQPGAAGTVINNLVALGVKCIPVVSVIGDDGEGYELRRALGRMGAVDPARLVTSADRRTSTYIKPMYCKVEDGPLELSRLDIKNRTATPEPLQDLILEGLGEIGSVVDALLVTDQVSEDECGVVTQRVRDELAALGEARPDRFILADSRARLHLYRAVNVKPNFDECYKAFQALGVRFWYDETEGVGARMALSDRAMVRELAARIGRLVFLTMGEKGMVVGPYGATNEVSEIPAYPVFGPKDIVGAGDSAAAALACAAASGASPPEAAAFANLVASITIQQLGTTGTASPDQVRQRWREVRPG